MAVVMVVAAMAAVCSTLAVDMMATLDPVSQRARDGPADVVADVRVTTPVTASTSREYDCQADVSVTMLDDGTLRRASHATARLFADQAVCAALANGARLSVRGRLQEAEYGAQRHWLLVEGAEHVILIEPPNLLRRAINRMHEAFFAVTERLDDQGQVLVPGLTLGVLGQDHYGAHIHEAYATRLEDAFQRAGIMHLMAVSGAHFVLIASLVKRLGGWLLLPRALVAALMALVQMLLAEAMFPADSVTRALIMGMFTAAGLAVGRRAQALSSLCWTVIGVILFDPTMSRSFGFALSSAAVLGIILFSGPLTRLFAQLMPKPLAAAIGVTAAAQSLTLPIQVLMEPELPLLSIPANALVAPFVGFATLAGLGALAIAWCWPDVAHLLAWLSSCGTLIMERVALWLGDGSHATVMWIGSGGGLRQGNAAWIGKATGALAILGLQAALALTVIWLRRRLCGSQTDRADGQPFRVTPRDRASAWWKDVRRMRWALSSDTVRLKPWQKQQRRTRR